MLCFVGFGTRFPPVGFLNAVVMLLLLQYRMCYLQVMIAQGYNPGVSRKSGGTGH